MILNKNIYIFPYFHYLCYSNTVKLYCTLLTTNFAYKSLISIFGSDFSMHDSLQLKLSARLFAYHEIYWHRLTSTIPMRNQFPKSLLHYCIKSFTNHTRKSTIA